MSDGITQHCIERLAHLGFLHVLIHELDKRQDPVGLLGLTVPAAGV